MKLGRNSKKIALFPFGGLGNRMRTIASAVSLAEEAEAGLEIVWYAKQDLNASFNSLFQPIETQGIHLHERGHTSYRLQKWLVPQCVRAMFYDKCFWDLQKIDFGQLGQTNYISSCFDFYPYHPDLPRRLFRPSAKLQERIEEVLPHLEGRRLGVHIRRTDHADAISQSPTNLFMDRMSSEIERRPDTVFYLATDSEEDKRQMLARFGGRVVTNLREAARSSTQGMEDALVEMFLLSHTEMIIGSFQSTFSEMAARLGNIPCEYICKNKRQENPD